jgi:Ca-activated chloride channel family protein
MSIVSWLRTPRIRRSVAASAIVLASGGCILYRAHPTARALPSPTQVEVIPGLSLANAVNATSFSGAGAHGQLALSHAKVLSGAERQVFAVLTMTAESADIAHERAPLSIAVVLDTSGSMEGDKIQQAKDSVVRMVRDMRDDDEIAVVRYSDDSEVLQSLARVGSVRGESLIAKVRGLRAGGGTAIPRGLSQGMRSLEASERGRVRRVVLVSDGLDSTRVQSERLASASFESGVVVSSMGIGLDFDESYMGAVARAGHGNFAFVEDAAALATFLRRELQETASTTIERATARLALPKGVRFVRAMGADANATEDGVELKMGSLFAGDERRVVVELAAKLDGGESRAFGGSVSWSRIGGGGAEARLTALGIEATDDKAAVQATVDGAVLANATSVLASTRQLEATEAYNHGDQKRAQELTQANMKDLAEVAANAPAPMATALTKQKDDYAVSAQAMASAAPTSDRGKHAAKQSAQRDLDNVARPSSTWSGSSLPSSPAPRAIPTSTGGSGRSGP